MTTEDAANGEPAERWIFSTRLLIAAGQALALYLLTTAAAAPRQWPATEPALFGPLLLVSAYVPLLALLGLGKVPIRPLLIWLAAASAVIAGLGHHDAVRGRIERYVLIDHAFWPWLELWLVLAVGLFIAQVLLIDTVNARHWRPPYPRHFDTAWKQGVQTVLTIVFVAVFWGVLELGSALFQLVKIDLLHDLIEKRWFDYPATTLAVALSVHVTDVQPNLIRGARSLALTLFSWLEPVLALILLGFLGSLPFVSLKPLWNTHFAAGTLLFAAAALIFLINCCYQDGAAERTASRIKRLAGIVGALELIPLVGLAVWGIGLRVGQYGWTTERIFAVAIAIAAACYALGYAAATLPSSGWLKRLEATNFVAAYLVLALILALFSPLADPARIMVADQIARLRSGVTPADKFDFVAMKFDGARWGKGALEALSRTPDTGHGVSIRARASEALAMKNENDFNAGVPKLSASEMASHVTVYPVGRALPASFFEAIKSLHPAEFEAVSCFGANAISKCEARFLTLRPGGPEAVLLFDQSGYLNGAIFEQDSNGAWRKTGDLNGNLNCPSVGAVLRNGDPTFVSHPWSDIVVGNQHFVVMPSNPDCSVQPSSVYTYRVSR